MGLCLPYKLCVSKAVYPDIARVIRFGVWFENPESVN